jgi:hypothetical protein
LTLGTPVQTLLRGCCDCCDVDGERELDREISDPYHAGSSQTLRCNICGGDADFIVQLELIKEQSNYNVMESVNQMPFYLCRTHEYLYKKMQYNIELKDYFSETISGYK